MRLDRSISAVVDGYCSKPKSINSGVPQGSVLSPTLFLLFINDLLSITDCPIHSYADDSTLHCSITFKSRPSKTELHNVRLDVTDPGRRYVPQSQSGATFESNGILQSGVISIRVDRAFSNREKIINE